MKLLYYIIIIIIIILEIIIIMSLYTSNWHYLGDQTYKKFDICQMLWTNVVNLEDFVIATAPFGGPIGKFF